LETLLALLSRSGDFPQSAIDTIRAQATLIPAVARASNVTDNDTIALNKSILTRSVI
jgi:hypothetical protein